MIRVLLYLVAVALLAFGAVWLADRPGDVIITWQGQKLETSVMVLVVAVAAIAAATVLLWGVIRAILRTPGMFRRKIRERRGARGYRAVSQGLVAVGTGDLKSARKLADEARRYAPDEALTLLLTAQAAQLAGDRVEAERIFHIMADRADTRLLGLHGLFIEARRRGDSGGALMYAEEAAKDVAAPAWAVQAVFDARCMAGDWTGALERLERIMKLGLVDRARYRRQRAVLLTARALMAEDRDRAEARTLILDATKSEPTLVPAAALAGRLLGAAGELRRAARIVEAAWKANPHPDLAETYAHLRPGDSARERLVRIQALAAMAPEHVEAALAVARAGIDAQEFEIARMALAPLLASPTQRVAMLMSELEDRQHADKGRAREWMARAVHARRDPAWTADGLVSDRWMPVSPVTGRLDAFEWKDPLADLQPTGPLIEGRPGLQALIDRTRDAPAPPPALSAPAPKPDESTAADEDPPAAAKPAAPPPVIPQPAVAPKPAESKSIESKPIEIAPVEAKIVTAKPVEVGRTEAASAPVLAAPAPAEEPPVATGDILPPERGSR